MFAFLLPLIETLIEVFSFVIAAQVLSTITKQTVNQFHATRRDVRKRLLLLLHGLETAAKPFIRANAVITLVVSLLINAPRLYRTPLVTAMVGNHGSQMLVVVVVLGIGLLAFWLKRNYQLQYGFGEIAFAVGTAYNVSEKLAASEAMLSKWTALGGAVYVVSRGMGNVMEARRKVATKQLSQPKLSRKVQAFSEKPSYL